MEGMCITSDQGIINKPVSINTEKVHMYFAINSDACAEVRNYPLKYACLYVYIHVCVY